MISSQQKKKIEDEVKRIKKYFLEYREDIYTSSSTIREIKNP